MKKSAALFPLLLLFCAFAVSMTSYMFHDRDLSSASAQELGTGGGAPTTTFDPWVKSDVSISPEEGGGGHLQIEVEHGDLYLELDVGWTGDDSSVSWRMTLEDGGTVRYVCDTPDQEGRLICRRLP